MVQTSKRQTGFKPLRCEPHETQWSDYNSDINYPMAARYQLQIHKDGVPSPGFFNSRIGTSVNNIALQKLFVPIFEPKTRHREKINRLFIRILSSFTTG
jgi:hypothetical protein